VKLNGYSIGIELELFAPCAHHPFNELPGPPSENTPESMNMIDGHDFQKPHRPAG